MLASVDENKSSLNLKHNKAQAFSTDFSSFVNFFTLSTGIKSGYLKGNQKSVPKSLIEILTKLRRETIHHK
jgi:hypothetical protein